MNLDLNATQILDWAEQYAVLAVAGPVGVLAGLALVGLMLARATRGLRAKVRESDTADLLTIVAAAVATVVTATGMWQVFTDTMPLPILLRIPVFAFIELATVTSAVRARKNSRENPEQGAGVDGLAVWVLTAVTAVLSSLDSSSLIEALIRLAAPVIAAWLWERGMHVERARVRPADRAGIHWRLTPERILVRLGLAEPTARDAGALAAERRLTSLAVSAARAHLLEATGAWPWRRTRALRRVQNAMRAAVVHTDLTTDTSQQAYVLGQYNSLVHASALTRLDQQPAWLTPRPFRPAAIGAATDPGSIVFAGPDQIAKLRDALRPETADDTTEPSRTVRAEGVAVATGWPSAAGTALHAEWLAVPGVQVTAETATDGRAPAVSGRLWPEEAEAMRPSAADHSEPSAANGRQGAASAVPEARNEPESAPATVTDIAATAARPVQGDEDGEPVGEDEYTDSAVADPVQQLADAIKSGELEPTASAEVIREHLKIPRAQARTARQWARTTLLQQAAHQITNGTPKEPLNSH